MAEQIAEAGTTQNTDTSQVAGTDQQAATEPAANATEQSGSNEQQASTEQDGAKQESTETTEAAKPQGAPEKYEFKAPEGVNLADDVIAEFSTVAKELDLSQEAAQKLVDKVGPAFAKQQANLLEKARTDWAAQASSDKEYGGEKMSENLAIAKKGLDAIGTPELRTLLETTGLGNHPEIIRAFFRTGKAISEDKFVPGGTKPGSAPKDAATALYGNQTS